MSTTPSPRSVLFVPATRPDRYPKALASGADMVCVDLEDAVARGEKTRGRRHVVALLAGGAWVAPRSMIRINHPGGHEGGADLRAIMAAAGPAADSGPLVLMVPKVNGPEDLEAVRRASASAGVAIRLVPVIETARGLAEVERIAVVEDLLALLFGGADLSAELGCALEWTPLLYARSRIVHAAALGGVAALDVPFFDIPDVTALRAEAGAARRLGFTGKAAVHPDQVGPIHDAFTPAPDEVERARRVLEAVSEGGDGVLLVDGSMVDRPVVDAARRTLVRAGLLPSEGSGRHLSRSPSPTTTRRKDDPE